MSKLTVAILLVLQVVRTLAAPANTDSSGQRRAYTPQFVKSNNLKQFEGYRRYTAGILDLNPDEERYVQEQERFANRQTQAWLVDMFGGGVLTFFDLEEVPRLAMATSGGGPRSLLTHAGVMSAFSQPFNSKSDASLINAMSYMSSVSTGSWLTAMMSSNEQQDDESVRDIVDIVIKPRLASADLFPDPDDRNVTLHVDADVEQKKAMNDSSVSSADTWSRTLAYTLFTKMRSTHGANLQDVKLSQILSTRSSNPKKPVPIFSMLDLTNEDMCLPSEDAFPFEATPFELGTWSNDVSVPFFVKTHYLDTDFAQMNSTNVNDKDSTKSYTAQTGFDDLALIAGMSSFDVNQAHCPSTSNKYPDVYREWVSENAEDSPHSSRAVAGEINNPIYKTTDQSGTIYKDREHLRLVDGSENNHGLPLLPLLHPSRDVDVIFAVDASGDEEDYPDGSQLFAVSKIARKLKSYKMPQLPKNMTQWRKELGHPEKPVVFGCHQSEAPSIIYLPYGARVGDGPTDIPMHDAQKWDFTEAESEDLFKHGMAIGYQNNRVGWSKCVGCFVLDKAVNWDEDAKDALRNYDKCGECFDHYCYREPHTPDPTRRDSTTSDDGQINMDKSDWEQKAGCPFNCHGGLYPGGPVPPEKNEHGQHKCPNGAGRVEASLLASVLFTAVTWVLL